MSKRVGQFLLALGATLALGTRTARAQTTDAFSMPTPRDGSVAQDASDTGGPGSACRCSMPGPTGLETSLETLLVCGGCLLRRRRRR
jgi:hypothetical protein